MLSEESVEKFRELYRARFGEEISKDEAYERGTRLLNLVRLVYRPIPRADQNDEN